MSRTFLPVILHNITLPKLSEKILIMGDNDELKIRVGFTLINDTKLSSAQEFNNSTIEAYSTRLAARASIFSVSSAFVGSSRAKIPQF